MIDVPEITRDGTDGVAPIFVGGTGRSGTWVIGRLLNQDPRLATVDTEMRFHAVDGGFQELLNGQMRVDRFVERMREYWFRRRGVRGQEQGLHLLVDEITFVEALDRFSAQFERGRPDALRRLFLSLVSTVLGDQDAETFVETTPANVRAAQALTTVFPGAKVIHTVRDGRDVALSVTAMAWGPSDPFDALGWWADALAEAHAGTVGLGPERLLVIRLEELVELDRGTSFARLLDFVGGDPSGRMSRYFERRIGADRAHLGRYRDELPRDLLPRFEANYAYHLDRLRSRGVTCLPVPVSRPRR